MLTGSKVVLRDYKKEDVKKAHKYMNDYDIIRVLSLDPVFPKSLEQEEKFIMSIKEDGLNYNFAIEDLETKEYIGGCGIKDADAKNRTCSIGVFIGEKNLWGKGYGTDALETLISFIFNELNFEKIKLSVYSFNDRAIKCYTSLGFTVEGTLEREIFREGKYHNIILMAMFREDYF